MSRKIFLHTTSRVLIQPNNNHRVLCTHTHTRRILKHRMDHPPLRKICTHTLSLSHKWHSCVGHLPRTNLSKSIDGSWNKKKKKRSVYNLFKEAHSICTTMAEISLPRDNAAGRCKNFQFSLNKRTLPIFFILSIRGFLCLMQPAALSPFELRNVNGSR